MNLTNKHIADIRTAAKIAAPVFEANDWTWWTQAATSKDRYQVPSEDRIFALLLDQIDRLDENCTEISSGRFTVRLDQKWGEISIDLDLGRIYVDD